MPEQDDAPGAWSEYRRLVIAQLASLEMGVHSLRDAMTKQGNETRDTIERHNKETDDDVAKLRERLAIIETKAAALGFAAGLAVSIGAALLKKFI